MTTPLKRIAQEQYHMAMEDELLKEPEYEWQWFCEDRDIPELTEEEYNKIMEK